MRHVAFLRNLNQGQRDNPTSVQLIEAFGRAGASAVSLVRGNGTVLFAADHPEHVANAAAAALLAVCGWRDVVFVRSTAWIADLRSTIDSRPEDDRRLELALFDESVQPVLPIEGHRCEVVTAGPGFAVVLNDRDGESNGTPTLERALGTRVTSRGLTTLRLIPL